MKSEKVIRLAQMAMLAAVACVVALIHFPLFPLVSFLEFDMADVPVLIGALLYGSVPGLLILLVVSTVQAFLYGGNGWVGLVMHFVASGAMVVIVGQFYRWRHKYKDMAVGMALGTVCRAAVMIPMNLIFTVNCFGVPKQTVLDLMLPGIIPFNLIQAGVNCILAAVLFRLLLPFFRKNRNIVRPV